MSLCSIECVQKILQYLDLSPIKLYMSENNIVATDSLLKDETVEGFSTIVQASVIKSKHQTIFREDDITRALIRQWLEYAAVCVNYADIPVNSKRVLKELNQVLKRNTYVSGTTKTIADVALYYALYFIMRELTNQEKAENVHVSRWFDNIQQDEKIRQKLDIINFNAISLYL